MGELKIQLFVQLFYYVGWLQNKRTGTLNEIVKQDYRLVFNCCRSDPSSIMHLVNCGNLNHDQSYVHPLPGLAGSIPENNTSLLKHWNNFLTWKTMVTILFVCVGVMYSGEYLYGVTLSVHPHGASWKVCLTTVGIEPATFGILVQCSTNLQLSYEVKSVRTWWYFGTEISMYSKIWYWFP